MSFTLRALPWFFIIGDAWQVFYQRNHVAVGVSRALGFGCLVLLLSIRSPRSRRFPRIVVFHILLVGWLVGLALLDLPAAPVPTLVGLTVVAGPLALAVLANGVKDLPRELTNSFRHWIWAGAVLGVSVMLQAFGLFFSSARQIHRPGFGSVVVTNAGLMLEPGRASRFLFVSMLIAAYMLMRGTTRRTTNRVAISVLPMAVGTLLAGGRLTTVGALGGVVAMGFCRSFPRIKRRPGGLRRAKILVPVVLAAVLIGPIAARSGSVGLSWVIADVASQENRESRMTQISGDYRTAIAAGGLTGRGIRWNVLGIDESLVIETGFAAIWFSYGAIGVVLWVCAGLATVRILWRRKGQFFPLSVVLAVLWFYWLPMQNFTNYQDPLVSWITWLVIGVDISSRRISDDHGTARRRKPLRSSVLRQLRSGSAISSPSPR